MKKREEILWTVAKNYHHFLDHLLFDNALYMRGINEASIKIIANLHIPLIKEELPWGYKDLYYSTDYVSEGALALLKKGTWGKKELVYEHIVPKTEYIRNACERKAKNKDITVEFIYNLLHKYLWTATILASEDSLLLNDSMPKGWDEKNIFARYDEAKIKLIPHDKSYFLKGKTTEIFI